MQEKSIQKSVYWIFMVDSQPYKTQTILVVLNPDVGNGRNKKVCIERNPVTNGWIILLLLY